MKELQGLHLWPYPSQTICLSSEPVAWGAQGGTREAALLSGWPLVGRRSQAEGWGCWWTSWARGYRCPGPWCAWSPSAAPPSRTQCPWWSQPLSRSRPVSWREAWTGSWPAGSWKGRGGLKARVSQAPGPATLGLHAREITRTKPEMGRPVHPDRTASWAGQSSD